MKAQKGTFCIPHTNSARAFAFLLAPPMELGLTQSGETRTIPSTELQKDRSPTVSRKCLVTKRFILGLTTLTLFFAATDTLMADYVKFVRPNDPTGTWYTNTIGRPISHGVVFQMTADTTIDGVGIGRGWGGSMQISEVTSLGPNLETGAKILRTSLGIIPSEQSYWLNYPITPLLLQKGHDYHIEFIGTPGTQSFFSLAIFRSLSAISRQFSERLPGSRTALLCLKFRSMSKTLLLPQSLVV
jgi:hypothetical protein